MKDSALEETYRRLGVNGDYDGRGRRRRVLGNDDLLVARQKDDQLLANMRLARTLIPLRSLTESHLEALLRNSTIEIVFRGQVLFEESSYDGQHIYLLNGEVQLGERVVHGSDSLLPLAHQQPRPCQAVARTDCSVLRIDSEYLDKMLAWSQVAEYMLLDIAYQRDLDEDALWMMTILKSNLFQKVPPINAHVIFDRLQTLVVDAGEAVLRQGEIGDHCYFIKQGEAEVRQSPDGMTPPVKIAEIGPGRCFGEDALVNETVRNASVIMKTAGVLMYISKRSFLKLLKEPMVETVGVEKLADRMERGAICIDVRTEEEYEADHLERAINIPLHLLRIKTRLLSADACYVLYCDTGRRSRAAAHLLDRAGFKAAALEGGLHGLGADRTRLAAAGPEFLIKDGQLVEADKGETFHLPLPNPA